VADIAAYGDLIQASVIPLKCELQEHFYGCQDLKISDPNENFYVLTKTCRRVKTAQVFNLIV